MLSAMEHQLEMTLGPSYVVEVSDQLTERLSRRNGREYASPPQSLEDARRLAALLLDREELPEGEGPWRRPLAGGQRHVSILPAPPGRAWS